MDMSFKISQDSELEYAHFQKQSDSGVKLNHESCIPQHIKSSVAIQQFRRAATLSSNGLEEERSKGKIRVLFSENGYLANAIDNALQISEDLPRRLEQTRNNACVAVKLQFVPTVWIKR